jgi:sulfite exporter TauE/SafE
MQMGLPLLLASIESIRPVFLIVMGISLLMLAWRLSKEASPWSGRFIITGAMLLALGYSVVMPLYEAGKIEHISEHIHGDMASAMAWHVVKLVSMNTGWFFFGLGLALHANVFSPRQTLIPAPR